jgi:hypothetical protein
MVPNWKADEDIVEEQCTRVYLDILVIMIWDVDFERWSAWVDALDAYKCVSLSIDWTNFLSEKYFCGGQADVPEARCVHHHLQGGRLLEPFLGIS